MASRDPRPPAFPQRRPGRLAVGIGDPEREREILPALDANGDFILAERCLGADMLLDAVVNRRVDAVLVSYDLHRLSRALPELDATGIPRVLLVPDPEDERWQALRGVVLPSTASPELIVEALHAAVRGEAFGRPQEAHVQPMPAFMWLISRGLLRGVLLTVRAPHPSGNDA